MKPSHDDIVAACAALAVLRFYPSDTGARKAIMTTLSRMVPSREALAWLVRTMVNHVGEWPGPRDLRGVLCTRYRPLDGIEAECSSKGPAAAYSPDAQEWRAIEAGSEQKQLGAGAGLRLLPAARGVPDDDLERKLREIAARSKARLGPVRQREASMSEVNQRLRDVGAI